MATILLAGEVLAAALLASTGIAHFADRDHFADVLIAQRVTDQRATAAIVGVAVAASETGAAATITLGWVDDSAFLRRMGVAVATSLFAVFTLHLFRLVRSGASVECGCGSGAHPVGWPAIVRSAVLFGLSAAALVAGVPIDGGAIAAVAIASGLIFVPIVMHLPAAVSGWGSTELVRSTR